MNVRQGRRCWFARGQFKPRPIFSSYLQNRTFLLRIIQYIENTINCYKKWFYWDTVKEVVALELDVVVLEAEEIVVFEVEVVVALEEEEVVILGVVALGVEEVVLVEVEIVVVREGNSCGKEDNNIQKIISNLLSEHFHFVYLYKFFKDKIFRLF